MVENNSVPQTGGQTQQTDSQDTANASQNQGNQVSSQIPEHLRGKSTEELAEMYRNLEKKLGEQSSEVSEARQIKKDMGVLVQAIYSKPEYYNQATGWINEYLGISDQTNDKSGDAKGDKETTKNQPTDDTRRALQSQILTDFYRSTGIDRLPKDAQQAEQKKVASQLAELLDPEGTKPFSHVFNSIPLDKLPKYLESAYKVANPDYVARSNSQAGDNSYASIGSMSSTASDSSGKPTLSQEEVKVAKSLGLTPEQYLQGKTKSS